MKPKVIIIRAAGTNCDIETARAVEEAGMCAHIIHTKKLIDRCIDLSSFHALIIPGGFSYGDYVRAGAIWASKIRSKIIDDVISFCKAGKPILGICNGFQVLVEIGVLPGFNGDFTPKLALAPNDSGKFECRWVFLKPLSRNNVFMRYYDFGRVLKMPVAHSEGKLIASNDILNLLFEKNLVAFKYCMPDGSPANGLYPFNPNGSYMDIAGILNVEGNVMGLMPHPERATYFWQNPDFVSKKNLNNYGDGFWIFKSIYEYIVEEIL